MVLQARRRYVIELLLVVSVCLLTGLSASELVPAGLDVVPVTHGTAAEPEPHPHLPQPDGHGALHALSLCVAVVVAAGVLASVRARPRPGRRAGFAPAVAAMRARASRTLGRRPCSPVTVGVLLRV